MAAPKKAGVSSGKTPARGGQKAVVKPVVKPTAATSKGKPVVGAKKSGAAMPKTGAPKGKGGGYAK